MEARMKKLVGAGRGSGATQQDHTGRVTLTHSALGRDPIELINANGDPTEHGKRGTVSRELNPLQLTVTTSR